jgi:hypothetical protein
MTDDPFDPDYAPWRKKRHSVFSSVVVANAFVQIVGASQKRVGLILTGHVAGELQYTPIQNATGHQSINMPTASEPVVLDEAVVGDIVKRNWFVMFTAGGPSSVGIIEIMTD